MASEHLFQIVIKPENDFAICVIPNSFQDLLNLMSLLEECPSVMYFFVYYNGIKITNVEQTPFSLGLRTLKTTKWRGN